MKLRAPSPTNKAFETSPIPEKEAAQEEIGYQESKDKKQKLNLVNMPPPETLLSLRRQAKDRYRPESDDHEGNIYIPLPKERLHMAKMYRNQIIKGIKRDKDKERLNQDLVAVKSDSRPPENGRAEANPIEVTPKKEEIRKPGAVRVDAQSPGGNQIVMPPCISVVPKMVNKNNLIGLHRAKRTHKHRPKSPRAQ